MAYSTERAEYDKIREAVLTSAHSDVFSERFTSTQTEISPSDTSLSSLYIPEQASYEIAFGDPGDLDSSGVLYEYSDLKSQNPDLAGWILMPGFKTPVSYPVLQTDDNEYYLDRDFYLNNSYAGSIFLDYRNSTTYPDRHTIIYGHAMNDRSMFGNLKDFPDKPENYLENRTIYLDFLNVRMEYEIFSIYYEDEKYNYRQLDFYGNKDYLEFLERISGKSVHDFDAVLKYSDRILTLSTCNNTLGKNIRSIAHAKLKRIIDYSGSAVGELISDEIISGDKSVSTANVYLSSLILSYETETEKVILATDPPFAPIYAEYSVNIPVGIDEVKIEVSAADPSASIRITADGAQSDGIFTRADAKTVLVGIDVRSRDGKHKRKHYVTMIWTVAEETSTEAETTVNN